MSSSESQVNNQAMTDLDYKTQLDMLADGVKNPQRDNGAQSQNNSLVDKG
jgi:hypothetical protein